MGARVSAYVQARHTDDESTLFRLESYITELMVEASTPRDILHDVLMACLSNACGRSSAYPKPEAEYLIVIGLRNPNCPEGVLALACHHENLWYRSIAAQHPNCPDADAVQVVLADDAHLPVMIAMRHTHTSFDSGITYSEWMR